MVEEAWAGDPYRQEAWADLLRLFPPSPSPTAQDREKEPTVLGAVDRFRLTQWPVGSDVARNQMVSCKMSWVLNNGSTYIHASCCLSQKLVAFAHHPETRSSREARRTDVEREERDTGGCKKQNVLSYCALNTCHLVSPDMPCQPYARASHLCLSHPGLEDRARPITKTRPGTRGRWPHSNQRSVNHLVLRRIGIGLGSKHQRTAVVALPCSSCSSG